MTRTILHVDMDAFYASIEVRDRPELRGQPVIVGGHPTRGVVLTCTYEARQFGVRSAMSMVEARKRAPRAIVVPPRFPQYVAASQRIFEVFRSFTPHVEGLSLDEAFLDVTSTLADIAGPARDDADVALARELKARVAAASGGLTCSVGIAASKFVAKVASDLRKPNGLVRCWPGAEPAFLGPLGVERLWGVGPKTAERLHAVGLRTIRDVQTAGEATLVEAVGFRHARHLAALAFGEDSRPVDGSREAKSIGSENTFERDERDFSVLRNALVEHADDVAQRLRRSGLAAGSLTVKVKYENHQLRTRRSTVPALLRDAHHIHALATVLLRDLWHPGDRGRSARAVRLVGLSVGDLVADRQLQLFDDAPEPP